MLLNMCSTFGLYILNGTCKGDLHGRYTYVTGLGCSVIDYFIASEELYYELLPVSELPVAERIESSHLPVELVINTRPKNALGATNSNNGKIINRIVWKNEKIESFLQSVKSAQIQEQINNATSLIGTDINMALKIFNKCMLEAAHCMVTKTPLGKKKTVNNWFDYECVTTRRNVGKLLRKFRKSLNTEDRESYCKSRRE